MQKIAKAKFRVNVKLEIQPPLWARMLILEKGLFLAW
jgi:hypothetical protein